MAADNKTENKEELTIDLPKLLKGLEKLTGEDYVNAELAAREAGDRTAEIGLSKNFQAHLAAKALGVEVVQILDLPINKFVPATGMVMAFLSSTLDEKALAQLIGKSQ